MEDTTSVNDKFEQEMSSDSKQTTSKGGSSLDQSMKNLSNASTSDESVTEDISEEETGSLDSGGSIERISSTNKLVLENNGSADIENEESTGASDHSETQKNEPEFKSGKSSNKTEFKADNLVDKKSKNPSTINKTILTKSVSPESNKVNPILTSEHSHSDIIQDDPTMPDVEAVQCPKGILHDLAEPDFNMWRLDRDGMVEHIEYMFHDLGIARAWNIPRTTLKMFLLGVRERYQDNPYHNFKHCFCVTQMAYSILCKLRLRNLLSVDHMGALLTAAVCHDVDHPGLNNSYHCHARTPLAILYNYQSILEQHHFAVMCRIVSNKERNIFRNVSNREEVLTNIGELILSTDLAHHKKISEDFNNCITLGFDFQSSDHVMALMKVIIKCSDISNEVRPETVAGPWVERLFAEYYEQSAREKRERLPVTPYMDPDLVNVSESQESFIRGMMLPIFRQLEKLSEDATTYYINPLYETLMRYEVQNLRNRQTSSA